MFGVFKYLTLGTDCTRLVEKLDFLRGYYWGIKSDYQGHFSVYQFLPNWSC